MAVSTAHVVIEEHNTYAKVAESHGSVPWDDVAWECSFYNAKISRELYGQPDLDVAGIEGEIPPVRLFDREQRTFPIGFKRRITEFLEGQGIGVEWIDKTVPPDSRFQFTFQSDEETREYQHRTLNELLEHRFGMLQAPTGSGKSHVMARIIERIGTRTLIVVHTADLVGQTVDFLEAYLGLNAGTIGGGTKFQLGTVTVATVHSLRSKWGQIQRRGWMPGLLIEDEVHHHGAWKNYCAMRAVPAYYRYGLSATPDRRGADRLLLEAGYGRVEAKADAEALAKQGYLSSIKVRVREVKQDIPKGARSWQEVYTAGIVEHAERNGYIAEDVRALRDEGRQVLVDIHETDHIEQVMPLLDAELNPSDIVRVVTGEMPAAQRKEIYASFKTGETQVLVGTVLKEGLDLPNTQGIVMGGGKKSAVQVMQQIGRGFRIAAGKEDCIVCDYNDNQHGTLFEHSQNRLKLMRHAGFDVPHGVIRVVVSKKVAITADDIEKGRQRQEKISKKKKGNAKENADDRRLARAEKTARKQQNSERVLKEDEVQ